MASGFVIPRFTVRTRQGSRFGELADLTRGHFKGSVGAGGQNRREDVGLIQKMLNAAAVPVGLGALSLKVDGRCGALTIAAINAYQQARFNTSDGRIDPGRATIRWLALDAKQGSSLLDDNTTPILQSQRIGAVPSDPNWDPWAKSPLPVPVAATNKEQARANRAFRLLPTIRRQALTARRVLDVALGSGPDTPLKRTAIALVIKHFASARQVDPLNTIRLHQGSINQIYTLIVANVMLRATLPQLRGCFVGVDKLHDHPDPSYLAEAPPGGAYLGLSVVWLGATLDTVVDDEAWSGMILHELAHFVGSPPGGETFVQSIGDLYANNPAYRHAETAQRIVSATPFELFAVEAMGGTQKLRFHIDAGGEFDRPPILAQGLQV